MAQPAKKKKLNIGLIVLLLAFVGGGGFFVLSSLQGMRQKTQDSQKAQDKLTLEVDKGDIVVEVVETGPLEARKVVEVKSRVSGRISQLFFDEGDFVQQGELMAIIDPQETQLQVDQNEAQLSGAQSGVSRIDVEISQRQVTVQTALAKAQSRVRQLEAELKVQPTLTNAAIRSSESALASARQGLKLLVEVNQPAARVQAESAVDEARANITNSEIEFQRRTGLFEKGYISRRELESAELSLRLARARLTTAQDSLARIAGQQNLEKRQQEERVAQAEADLARSKANSVQDGLKNEELRQAKETVREAQTALRDVQALRASRGQSQASVRQLSSVLGDARRQLGETRILAPVSGIVTRRFVQIGELVASLSGFSAGTPVFQVEDRGGMKVQLSVNEIDVARLTMGGKAEIKIDAFPNKAFQGRISKISPAAIAATPGSNDPVVKYEVEVTLVGVSSEIKSGMSAKCTMRVVDLPNVVRVRLDSVSKEPDGRSYVWVIEEGTTWKTVPGKTPAEKPTSEPEKKKKAYITLGPSSGAFVQVLSGVKVGDKLFKPPFTGPNRSGFFGGRGGASEEETDGEKKDEAAPAEETKPAEEAK